MLPAQPTAVHSLLEHSLNHVRTMARQQRFYVPHRFIRNLKTVLHNGRRVEVATAGCKLER
jgi:hypothetical protein